MKSCRIAVIGAGGIASGIHLPVLSRLETVEITAVCDSIKERAEKAAKTFHIPKIYSLYSEMLQSCDVDAVFVLTQPDQLFRIASDCLHAGKHVFMEKPMGITVFQANSLREYAIKNKRILHVGFNRRYIPLIVETVSQLNRLTKINQISGYFYKNSSASFYGGCASSFICDVIHVIDLVRHIAVGPETGTVSHVSTLEGVNPDTGIPEMWHSVMRFDNGIHAVIGANYHSGARVHRFELHGVGAAAYINLGFGDSGCDSKILCDGASFSIVSSAASHKNVMELNGMTIAGSERYEDYYGYRDEDISFISRILENPDATDTERVNEDYSSMLLAETLLQAKRQ